MFQTTNPCDFMNFGGFNLPQTTKNICLSMPFQTSILKASGGFIVRAPSRLALMALLLVQAHGLPSLLFHHLR